MLPTVVGRVMVASLPDSVARQVLEHYPALLGGPLTALGNRGGFSGASLWRVGENCLRAWPAEGPSPERLRWIHHLMRAARNAGLPFVPVVWETSEGGSSVEMAGRRWELTCWQPGVADFHARPSAARLAAACAALAQIHAAWATLQTEHAPCPAVQRRLRRYAQWHELLRSGWRPSFACEELDPVAPWAARGWRALQSRLHRLPIALSPWKDRPLPLQPCLCDIWHDHVLFEGDAVIGLIDYGSARVDHVATDLARLLGDLVGDDASQWQSALAVYASHRRLSVEEMELARLLDWTGVLLGVVNWLRWLYHERRPYENRAGTARRLARLVERIERWP